MKSITATKALYIKLGEGGGLAHDCIENGYLQIRYEGVNHEMCMQGRWEEIKNTFPYGSNASSKTHHRNQVQKFYEEPETTLWVTFHGGALYWCFSKQEITFNDDETKTRPVINSWQNTNLKGEDLITAVLSGKLLATQAFQGTICEIRELSYLLHKINGTIEPHIAKAESALEDLVLASIPIIKNLHHDDLEILTDLIFRQAGWQRTGVSGGTLKDIDLDLISPITSERIAVQVKSRANASNYNDYKMRFETMIGFNKFYFVTHSPTQQLINQLNNDDEDDGIIFWDAYKLAEYSVKNGLTGWLINKAT
ncbi:MAG: hypothetical protein CMH23_02455 [Methylophaga sp.]|jgi:hypothetical protein|uniref:hypothetical protein n=1 Tax=Methylophaga sp. TaxID=2024840 RepID=UPI000C96F4A1|nr:hypothetical protein [Methylophaga sp.]MBN45314.1 hypothetical protein [Methylophaga sp.]|tara:strand:- start:4201 stop:5130 length:930 start_codon:yes stop_codon:yes gene_type:complete